MGTRLLEIGLWVFLLGVFGLGGWAGMSIYQASKSPTFTLYKNEWVCTHFHQEQYTSTLVVGKVIILQVHTADVCDVYERSALAPQH